MVAQAIQCLGTLVRSSTGKGHSFIQFCNVLFGAWVFSLMSEVKGPLLANFKCLRSRWLRDFHVGWGQIVLRNDCDRNIRKTKQKQ